MKKRIIVITVWSCCCISRDDCCRGQCFSCLYDLKWVVIFCWLINMNNTRFVSTILLVLYRDTYSALSLYTFVTNTGWSVSTTTFRRIFRYVTGIGRIRAVVVEQTGTFGLFFDILTDSPGLARCVAITFTQWGIICSIALV